MKSLKLGWMGAAIALTASIGASALAQDAPAAPPPARQGGGAGQGRGGFGGFGGATTLVNLPLDYMTSALTLTDEQKTKIQAIQEKSRTDLQDLRKPDASGQRPDRATLQPKMKAINDQAKKDIEAVLTAAQIKKSESVLKTVGVYNAVGIPLAVVADLKLTSEENTKLAELSTAAAKEQETTMKDMAEARTSGNTAKMQELSQTMQASRQATHDKALALLTDEQKATLAQYQKDHPRGNRGGGGARQPGAGGTILL